MTTTAAHIEREFQRLQTSVAEGLAAMNPQPKRPFNGQLPTLDPDTAPASDPAAESTAQRVFREAGLVGKINLDWVGLANVEALTAGLLSKKESARLLELEEACQRLAAEIHAAGETPINAGKLALASPLGELPPPETITAAAGGDAARGFKKKIAKAAAVRFFEEACKPAILETFAKVAAHLEPAILERHKAEEEAFEKFAALYHAEDDAEPYKPSAGLVRMMARRRQLLDAEIPVFSPPSVRLALGGIVAI